MTVVLDTNVIVQMFGARSPLAPLKDAIVGGRMTAAISTGVWLEYEEVTGEQTNFPQASGLAPSTSANLFPSLRLDFSTTTFSN